jgi:hypothetical protein
MLLAVPMAIKGAHAGRRNEYEPYRTAFENARDGFISYGVIGAVVGFIPGMFVGIAQFKK